MTLTLQAKDQNGNNETSGGLTVAILVGSTSLNVTDNLNGTYTAYFSTTTAGPYTATAKINGNPVSSTASFTVNRSDVIGDFAGSGVEVWNGTAWIQTSNGEPAGDASILSSNLYGDAVAQFTGKGVWFWNGNVWTQISTSGASGCRSLRTPTT